MKCTMHNAECTIRRGDPTRGAADYFSTSGLRTFTED